MRPHLHGAPRKITLSTVFAGQKVGVKQVGDKIWLVSFMDYDLGYFDEETRRLEPRPTRSRQKCYLCVRNKTVTYVTGTDKLDFGRGERIRTSDILLPKQARYRAALHPEGADYAIRARAPGNSILTWLVMFAISARRSNNRA